mgnify:CR=1 FL=1
MARVKIVKPETVDDPAVAGIFEWVTEMEGAVPNHFYIELNFPEFFTAKLGATKILWEAGELSMEEIPINHLRATETLLDLVCRLLLEKKNKQINTQYTHFSTLP